MNIEYYIINPTGNITALVTPPVPKHLYKDVATHIMQNNKFVEQVGFVRFESGKIILNMSGDEFCGNAAMSSAALNYMLSGENGEIEKNVVFLPDEEYVKVAVSCERGNYCCDGYFEYPREISKYTFKTDGKLYTFPLVKFKGITHIVTDETLSEQSAKNVIKLLGKKLGVKALGIMIFNSRNNTLKPFVYVPEVDTLFAENSCASGSCAVAAACGFGGENVAIIQPGGKIYAAVKDGKIILHSVIKISKKCSEEV